MMIVFILLVRKKKINFADVETTLCVYWGSTWNPNQCNHISIYTAQKMKFSIKDFIFLCSVSWKISWTESNDTKKEH